MNNNLSSYKRDPNKTDYKKLASRSRFGLFAARFGVYAVLIFLVFISLIWFFIMIINSMRESHDLQRIFRAIPENLSHVIPNFTGVFKNQSIPMGYGILNSMTIALSTAVLTCYFSALTAYALHAYEFKFKNAITTFILVVMIIPTNVSLAGFMTWILKLDMKDTYWPLIVPSIAAPAVFFFMRQYMQANLPMEIVEAARVDGSSEFRTFNQIVLPIMVPAIAVQFIFSFVNSWNNMLVPMLVIDTAEKKTLPYLIAMLRTTDYGKFDLGVVWASMVIAVLPVIIVYLIASRRIIGGVAAGSVKG